MSKEIFLTGATGNIGSKIVQELQNTNTAFTAGMTNIPEQPVGFSMAIMNFADKKSLVKAFEGVQTLFLLIPIVDPMMRFAKDAIAAAVEVGVQHIVRSSAAGADVNSNYKLLQAHGEIDNWLRESGMNFTITRPKSFMQNFVNFFAYNIKEGTVYSSTGNGKSAWVDTRDIAAVNAAILKNPTEYNFKTFDISGSEAFSMLEAVRRIAIAIEKKVNYIEIPQSASNETMRGFGMSDFVVEMLESIDIGTKNGMMEGISNDVEKILNRPPISFEQFIQDHLEAWK